MFQRPGSVSKEAFGVRFGQQQQQRHGGIDGRPLPQPGGAGAASWPHPSGAATTAASQQQQQQHGYQQQKLPADAVRRELLYLVETHATVVVVGETGSGKTTRVPRFLHEAGWTAGGRLVVCTQPRRVAAVAVATRVAEEMGVPLGTLVGYSVRFEDASDAAATRVKYVTDGLLLREMMDDPLLSRVSVVVVDEAHERSLATDALLGLLRKVQRRRPDLRVVVSSATLEVERLVRFFGGSGGAVAAAVSSTSGGGLPASRAPAVISIEGRTHPVQLHYLARPCDDYVRAAVAAAVDLHREDVPGDVLVFLTGQEEVEAAVALLQEEARHLAKSRLKYRLLAAPLYAGLPGAAQRAALEPTPRGARKVVVATNIAETSLTIEGVVYVIDCCFVKQRCYNPLIGLESLLVAPASKASCAQRAGRAGRVRAGHAFRLCTEGDYERLLPAASVPEMQRSDLAATVLQLKALGVDNVMAFDWLSPPPAEAAVRALELLAALGALDGDARLTPAVGAPLAELPLEPQLGAALLAATTRFGCCQELLTLAGMLSVPAVWAAPGAVGGRRALEAARAKFAAAEGDLVAYLNVHRAWLAHGRSHRWATRNGVRQHGMLRAAEVSRQLRRKLRALGFETDSSAEGDVEKVLKAVAAGLFMSAARYERTEYDPRRADDAGTNVYRLLRDASSGGGGGGGGGPAAAAAAAGARLRVHASSVLARTRPQLLLFLRCQQGDDGWYEMQAVTAVEPDWLLELAPQVYRRR